jgi:hypothetical protein
MALEADAVRFVLFDNSVSPANVLTLWQTGVNPLPQTFQNAPTPGAPSVASGTVGKFHFILAAQPGRLELAVVAPPPSVLHQPPDTIQDIQGALAKGKAIVRKILGRHLANRIGVVLDLSEVVADQPAACARMRRDLPFLAPPIGAVDLVWQLNMPYPSPSNPSIAINRHCKWATAQRQVLEMQMSPSGTQQQAPRVLSSSPVFSVTYDVNTAPVGGQLFNTTQARSFIGELSAEASELLTKGYGRFA